MTRDAIVATVGYYEERFGSLITSRQVPIRDVMRAVRAGLVASAGVVVVMDGDFAAEPERYREGFVLTETGRQRLATLHADTGARREAAA